MSDWGKNGGGGFPKWIFLIVFVVLSPWLGIYIDTTILFPPSRDAHGHGIPVFTILMPLFAIAISIIFLLLAGIKKALSSHGKRYEYLKIVLKCTDAQTPALILHEIDSKAGRCSIRCIQIYPNRYVECFMNSGVYVPVPTVESINASSQQSAYITGRQEFEEIWNSRRYMGPLML